MFSQRAIPSTTSILSMYTTVTASAMLVRGVVNEAQAIASQLIPHHLQTLLLSKFRYWLGANPPSQTMTLYIHEYDGGALNQLYEASEIYLGATITTDQSVNKLKVSRAPRDKALALKIERDENVTETFEGIQLHWRMTCLETKDQTAEKRVIELSFHNKFLDKVVGSYLPHVLERSKAIQEENKVVKLYSLGNGYAYTEYEGEWAATNLDHPSTFQTLAIDPKLKKELVDDLDRFVRRRDFYKQVGKAWKRGYLLYGPPGTGKSSLIAAMANYLKFSIYDLELTSIYSNSDLRRYLASTKNRSIVVIEDIDCSIEFKGRQAARNQTNQNDSKLTLSGLLNFIDGLYSSCGDERIIVFTTNNKDKLDPALLRPGRMDMHIHMSYCNPSAFRVLASNYLGITSHDLFAEIDELINEVEVTPAEVAGELMKSEDADVSLEGLIKFIQNKKLGSEKLDSDDGEANSEEGNESNECDTEVGNKRKSFERIDRIGKIAKRKRSQKSGPVVESNLKCSSLLISDQE